MSRQVAQLLVGGSYKAPAFRRLFATNSPYQSSLEVFKSRLGVDLKSEGILEQALTHKSYKHGTVPTNVRLELIGKTS